MDGCKGNKNVTDLIGDEIAVIDHHRVVSPEDVLFSDIRPESRGMLHPLLYLYLKETGTAISQDVATALMIGINMDTALLTREVSEEDIRAYSALFHTADDRLVNSILRNFIQVKDLTFYRWTIDNLKIEDTFGFCFFPGGVQSESAGDTRRLYPGPSGGGFCRPHGQKRRQNQCLSTQRKPAVECSGYNPNGT